MKCNKLRLLMPAFLSLLAGAVSCTKEEISCGADIVVDHPPKVNEGEDLTFAISGLENTGITYFLWECPDMQPYNILSEGRVHESSPQFTIEDFNIRDAGKYSVKMYPEGEDCAPVIVEKTVALKPQQCPCEERPLDNTLYYSTTYEGQFSSEYMTASVYNSNTEENSVITFTGTNTFQIFFGRKIPEHSSTFNIGTTNYTFWDEDNDPYLDVNFHLDGWNHGFDYFGFDDVSEKMYLTARAIYSPCSFAT